MKSSGFISIIVLAMALCACGTSRQAAQDPGSDQVNVGYGSTSQDDLTYSVSSLKPVGETDVYSNMYDYLRGRVAGLEVGPENSMSSVHIRGVNSLNASTAPLVVLDGVEVNDLDAVNPHDVYSVSVLKDASSSIYGVRGANGVILITTKGAQEAKDREAAARKKAREEKRASRAAKKK